MPYSRNDFFTGRKRVLGDLRKALTARRTAALVQAITGLGGVGKSQTAVEYAYRYRDEYPAGVYWARAENETTLHADYAAIAHALDLPEKNAVDAATIQAAVKRWLADKSGYLLVLDNADEPTIVMPFLPPAPSGHLLITSRSRHLAALSVSAPIDLGVMAPNEAVSFLLRRVRRRNAVAAERQAAADLAHELGHLPLALEQAAAFIATHDSRFTDYLVECRARLLALLEEQGPVVGLPLLEPDEFRQRATVRTVWERSFRAVREQSPASAELLVASAYLAPDQIPEELLIAGAPELGETLASALAPAANDRLTLDRLLRPLLQHSLIQRDRETKTFGIHRLVQEVVRAEADEEGRRLWSERVVRAVARAYPGPEFARWTLCDRWLPHALACAEWIVIHHLVLPEAVSVLGQAGFHLGNHAHYPLATVLYQGVLSILEQGLGPKHPWVSAALNNLTSLSRAQGKLSEAELLARRALAIAEAAYGVDHPEVGIIANNLALVCLDQEKLTEALPLLERALVVMERHRGSGHPDTATALNNLADLYRAQGKPGEAEPLFRRALAIRKQVLGLYDPHTAISLDNLAMICQEQGKSAEAESLHLKALSIMEGAVGEDHPDLAAILNNVAMMRYEQGNLTEARPMFERALVIRERVLGPAHPHTASSLYNLAVVYLAEGRLDEAEALLERASEITDKALGAEHPTAVLFRKQLAALRAATSTRGDCGPR